VADAKVVIKLESNEPEHLRQDLITAVNKAMNQGWVLRLVNSLLFKMRCYRPTARDSRR
jgi:hypothetical protein